ncbi:hypothetical protein PM082_022013 [Marasmius tenuissimus]|nr:hypothetical protein PM082_022013 [Marasmius tenuissimus]
MNPALQESLHRPEEVDELEIDPEADESDSEIEFIAEVKAEREPTELNLMNYTPENMGTTGSIRKRRKSDIINNKDEDEDPSDLPKTVTEAVKRSPIKKVKKGKLQGQEGLKLRL